MEDAPASWFPDSKIQSYGKAISADEADLLNKNFQPGLCERCRSVRWSVLAMMDSPFWSYLIFKSEDPDTLLFDTKINSEEPHEQLQESSCGLCRYFASLFEDSSDNRDWSLCADTLFFVMNRWQGTISSPPLLTFSSASACSFLGMLHPSSEEGDVVPHAITPFIDYAILQGWLASCEASHCESCQPDDTVNLPGFKVIDCRTRNVVPAPHGCRYVALSYVWGGSDSSELVSQTASQLPSTINDGITVTLKMGFRYLWVDRYCIDQQNAAEKHVQIAHMDDIYTQAQLTIIAAAGDNPHYGLPGVNMRPRSPVRCHKIDNIELVELRMNELSQIQSSSWAQRGWTFQEGYLSNRCLIFSDCQVSFVCNKVCCIESVRQSPRILTEGAGSNRISELRLALGIPTHGKDYVASMLEEYTARKLTYDTDILNACHGALNRICKSYIHGTPLEIDTSGNIQARLLWWLKRDSRWTRTQNRRRLSFPSWSWTGWQGPIRFCKAYEANKMTCIMEVPGVDGQWCSLKKYVETEDMRRKGVQGDQSRSLRITAPRMPAKFNTDPPSDHQVNLRYSYGKWFEAKIYLDHDTGHTAQEQLADAIALAIHYESRITPPEVYGYVNLGGLLLKPVGKVYQRVGLLEARYRDPFNTQSMPDWLLKPEMCTIVVE